MVIPNPKQFFCMKLFFLFSLLSIIVMPELATAQKNYQPGNVELANGTKLSGFINMQDWQKNPKKIQFKNSTGEKKIYRPAELRSFEVENNKYQVAIVKVDSKSVDVLDEDDKNESPSNADTVFLRVVVQGAPLSLYQFQNFRPHFYLKINAGEIMELTYGVNNETYKRQLNDALQSINDSTSFEAIKKINYNETELKDFLIKINRNTDFAAAKNPAKKRQLTFFAGAGASYQTFSFNSTDTRYRNLQFSNSINPLFCIGVEFMIGHYRPRIGLMFDISYSSFKTHGSFEDISPLTSQKNRYDYSIKQTNITPSLGVSYKFVNSGTIKVYAAVRMGVNISSYPENEYIIHNITLDTTRYNNPLEFSKSWVAIYGQLGIILKNKFELNVSSLVSGSYLNNAGNEENGTKLYFRLIYRFSK